MLRTDAPKSNQRTTFLSHLNLKQVQKDGFLGPCPIYSNSQLPVSNVRSQQETSLGRLSGLILPTSKQFTVIRGGKKWDYMDENAPSSLEKQYYRDEVQGYYYFYGVISEAQPWMPAWLLKRE